MKLILRDVPEELWLKAMGVAKKFVRDYPDRMGFSQLVIYTTHVENVSLAVYRTKTSIIVRGT